MKIEFEKFKIWKNWNLKFENSKIENFWDRSYFQFFFQNFIFFNFLNFSNSIFSLFKFFNFKTEIWILSRPSPDSNLVPDPNLDMKKSRLWTKSGLVPMVDISGLSVWGVFCHKIRELAGAWPIFLMADRNAYTWQHIEILELSEVIWAIKSFYMVEYWKFLKIAFGKILDFFT